MTLFTLHLKVIAALVHFIAALLKVETVEGACDCHFALRKSFVLSLLE